MCVCMVFFFKQKTAYDMRISDWSSDVCSSDLAPGVRRSPHAPWTALPTAGPARGRSRRSARPRAARHRTSRSEEHTSELQSLMRISYAVFCLKKKKKQSYSTDSYRLKIYSKKR